MSTDEPMFFDVLHNLTVARRFAATSVSDALIDRLLEAGISAPTGIRTQPWAFVVMRDVATKRFFADRYLSALKLRMKAISTRTADTTSEALAFADLLHTAPVIILVCGKREWLRELPRSRRVERPPPSLIATLPCAQNILLASHALGLSATMTVLHLLFEEELEHYLGMPEDMGVAAAIPVGYPAEPAAKSSMKIKKLRKYYDAWGKAKA